MKKDRHPLMFKDLPVWLQDVLRSLSREGFIYIGRTGPGPGGIAAAMCTLVKSLPREG